MAQPFARGWDVTQSDEALLEETCEKIAEAPELQPMAEWRERFEKRLAGARSDSACPTIEMSQ